MLYWKPIQKLAKYDFNALKYTILKYMSIGDTQCGVAMGVGRSTRGGRDGGWKERMVGMGLEGKGGRGYTKEGRDGVGRKGW